jgi:hypothetical protein
MSRNLLGVDSYSDGGIDLTSLKERHAYALGVYLLYFIGSLIVLKIIDRRGWLDGLVTMMSRSAEIQYNIQKHELYARRALRKKELDVPILFGGDIVYEENDAMYHSDIDDSLHHMEEAERAPDSGAVDADEDVLDQGFQYELARPLAPHAYFNIRSDLRPCCCMCCCCCKSSWLTDLMFYLMNNHQVLSMIACVKGHPFSRAERRMAYMLQQSFAFAMAAVVSTMTFPDTEYGIMGISYTLNDADMKLIVNMCIISPFIIILYKVIFLLFSCPCLRISCTWRWLVCIKNCIEGGSELFAAAICTIVGLFSIAYVSVFSQYDPSYSRLINYALEVQAVSAFLDTVRCMMVFFPLYIEIKILWCIPILNIGRWVHDMRVSKAKRYGTKPPFKASYMGLNIKFALWTYRKQKIQIAPAPFEPAGVLELEGVMTPSRKADVDADVDADVRGKTLEPKRLSFLSPSGRLSFLGSPEPLHPEEIAQIAEKQAKQDVMFVLLRMIRTVENRADVDDTSSVGDEMEHGTEDEERTDVSACGARDAGDAGGDDDAPSEACVVTVDERAEES